jgi:hypothetical protein
MGLLDGFDNGCGMGCGGLAGLGAATLTPAEAQYCIITSAGEKVCDYGGADANTPPNPCDDTSLWAVKKGQDGKCYNYCIADITQQHSIDDSNCAIGAPARTGKIQPKTLDTNIMLIGGFVLAAFVLSNR